MGYLIIFNLPLHVVKLVQAQLICKTVVIKSLPQIFKVLRVKHHDYTLKSYYINLNLPYLLEKKAKIGEDEDGDRGARRRHIHTFIWCSLVVTGLVM